HLLALLLNASIARAEIERLTSTAVAERFGLKQKGGIEVGKDADFSLVDLNDEETVTAETLLYRHRHTPYLGRKLRGRVTRTFLRGQTIFQDGKIVGKPHGRFVRPS